MDWLFRCRATFGEDGSSLLQTLALWANGVEHATSRCLGSCGMAQCWGDGLSVARWRDGSDAEIVR